MKTVNRLTEIVTSTKVFLAALLTSVATLTSCNELLYDYEGDCNPYYKVRFEYKHHMKQGDAFPYEVDDVTLYLIDDNTGKVVWQKRESGEALSREGYMMDVDVAPGTYWLIAWCGNGHASTFKVNDATIKTDLQCHLMVGETSNETACGNARHVRKDIKRLYYGTLYDENGKPRPQVFPTDEGTHIFTVPLIKNTNDIHVLMQHLSGDLVDISKFSFTITDDNAHMDWDNRLIGSEAICYHPWRLSQGAATTTPDSDSDLHAQTREAGTHSAALAEFTVGRLIALDDNGQSDQIVRDASAEGTIRQSPRLIVRNDLNEVVASIPLIEYFTMLKGHHTDMPDQEFLDRQDDYSLVLFLDKNQHWVKTVIQILSWQMVIQNTDI